MTDPIPLSKVLEAILPANFPNEERAVVDHVNLLLQDLDGRIHNFRWAVHLLDYCIMVNHQLHSEMMRDISPGTDVWPYLSKTQEAGYWCQIAAMDAAMSVYHFKKILEFIRNNAGQPKTFRNELDFVLIRRAVKLFKSFFPNAEKMRHIIAHSAEHYESIEHYKLHQSNGVYKIYGFSSETRAFEMTSYRKNLCIEVTEKSAERLEKVQQVAHSAFRSFLK